jgi:hypothetical protein
LDENMTAVTVSLTLTELRTINELLPAGSASGSRYHETAMKALQAAPR